MKLIQLIAGIKAIHQNLEIEICGVQALIYFSSIVEILILSTSWMRK